MGDTGAKQGGKESHHNARSVDNGGAGGGHKHGQGMEVDAAKLTEHINSLNVYLGVYTQSVLDHTKSELEKQKLRFQQEASKHNEEQKLSLQQQASKLNEELDKVRLERDEALRKLHAAEFAAETARVQMQEEREEAQRKLTGGKQAWEELSSLLGKRPFGT